MLTKTAKFEKLIYVTIDRRPWSIVVDYLLESLQNFESVGVMDMISFTRRRRLAKGS